MAPLNIHNNESKNAYHFTHKHMYMTISKPETDTVTQFITYVNVPDTINKCLCFQTTVRTKTNMKNVFYLFYTLRTAKQCTVHT